MRSFKIDQGQSKGNLIRDWKAQCSCQIMNEFWSDVSILECVRKQGSEIRQFEDTFEDQG